MKMNTVSKYIIIVLFVTSVLLGINIIILNIQNDVLKERNTKLSEMAALRDAVISEMDKNIKALQQQVHQAELICNERLKARNDLLTFLSLEPAYNVSKNGIFFPQIPSLNIDMNFGSQTGAETCTAPVQQKNDKGGIYEVISKNKSDYAVNAINSYWVQFTQSSYNKK